MGRDTLTERVDALGEDTLSGLSEQLRFGKQRAEIVRTIKRLREAGGIEEEWAEAHVNTSRGELHEALDHLSRTRETNQHLDEEILRLEQVSTSEEKTLQEDLRQVSIDLKNLGATYTRDELIAKGASALLERRKRVRAAGASKREAEAV